MVANSKTSANKQTQINQLDHIAPVSIEDINWVRQQPPSVQQLWLDSVAAEQFRGAAHKLDINLTQAI